MHITYILQGVCDQYTSYLVVEGCTVGQLRWMQGVKELSVFTKFPDKKNFWSKKRIVAILQPESFFQHVWFGDWVPCGSDRNDLTLENTPYLDAMLQAAVDKLSFTVGMQLGNYNEQVAGNTTSRVAGRNYRKDSYAYGAVGGLENGLLELPGVQFFAYCSNNSTKAEVIWRSVFPERSLPELSTNGTELVRIRDAPAPAEMRSVDSEAGSPDDESLGNFHHRMYALVRPTADGALITIEPDGTRSNVTVCGWRTLPKLVHAQTINFTARSLRAEDAKLYPAVIGRATWLTLQGMARAAHYGASLQAIRRTATKPSSQVLEAILADGGKAAITFYNQHFWGYHNPRKENKGQQPDAPLRCDSNNRTVSEHWRFGNSNHLGYIAIVLTIVISGFTIGMVLWLKPRRRLRDWTLGVAEVFELGRDGNVSQEQVFYVVNGKLVERI
ncbi:hypothetical protein EST38_g2683 [Candolleomyces aberdarensis]|uniref:Uncharacterized protein n=1 Tax=Candolleomyces aberdarensis TaxID=2316362 RepID=A0A4Q2DRT5_9AGAR|nr:hypothetical protein EST38_g2683 [Candolleomyces aberdarensis]